MGTVLSSFCQEKTFKSNPDVARNEPLDKLADGNVNPNDKSNYKRATVDDFILTTKLGQGGFGAVHLAVKKSNKKEYAIKIVKKKMFKNALRIKDALNEKNIMIKASNPFVIRLHYAFQDKKRIYYVMDFVKGGVLLKYISEMKRFDEPTTIFYAGQIVLALKYLHEEKNIVYRDLKPENILVDEHGYIKLSDFGLSSMGVERLRSLCGTYEYIAPEILKGKEYTKVIDYFSLGCLIYEMLHGYSPFANPVFKKKNKDIIKSIIDGNYEFSKYLKVSDEAKDLIDRLLDTDPEKRLGANGTREIQNHKFFKSLDWEELYLKKLRAPIKVGIVSGVVEKKNKFSESLYDSNGVVLGGFEYDCEVDLASPTLRSKAQ